MTKEEKMAYAAGLIDGDGSLSLVKHQEKSSRSPLYYPSIQFAKSRGILSRFLKETFGGNLCCSRGSNKNLMMYRWKIERCPRCMPFLNGIAKYLQNKSEQGKLLLNYMEKNCSIRLHRLTDDILIEREAVYVKMKKLNSRRDISSRLTTINLRTKDKCIYFWCYLAGLLDTDGSFSVKREKGKGYSPVLLLSLVNSKALNFIEKHCKKGSFFVIKNEKLKQGFYYRWGIYTKRDAIYVIKRVLPFLRHKKKSAEILLYFCENFIAQHGRYLKTKEQFDFRENCYKELIEANYGVYKPSLMGLKLLPGNAEDNKAEAGKAPGTVNVVSEKASLVEDDAEL